MALVLKYQTPEEFMARFWKEANAYDNAGQTGQVDRLFSWLLDELDVGDITDAQARTAYTAALGKPMTTGQWASYKSSRLQPSRARVNASRGQGPV